MKNIKETIWYAKLRGAGITITLQVVILCTIIFSLWGFQFIYANIDKVTFPTAFQVTENATLTEPEKGVLLLDSIVSQMRYELQSPFGWSANDFVFNSYILDNRAYRQYGVYHATKVLIDFYSMQLAKLGSNDRENDLLYKARLNNLVVNPSKWWFPSAEGAYDKALKLIVQYQTDLKNGKAVYNVRSDDIYNAFSLIIGENMLGFALGLLHDSQNLSFSSLDNRIYEVQGLVLVLRDFVNTLYQLYPEIKEKKNVENMEEALFYLDKISTYNPLYITSTVNSGELIISYLMFAKNRFEDVMYSIRN